MAYKGYKNTDIPWISTVPDTWTVNRGKALFYNPKEINKNGKYKNVLSLTLRGVIRNDVDNPIGLSPKSYDTYQLFEKDDLVFKLIDLENISTSRVGLVGEQGIMSSAYIRTTLREKTEHNIKYFYYQYYSLYLRNIFNGLGAGVRQTLSAGDLLSLKILVPTKEEQDQIVKYLDWKVSEINRFVNEKKRQIQKIRELKTNSIAVLIYRGSREHKYIKTGYIGLEMIPSDWKIVRNKNLFFERSEYSETGKERLLSVSKHFGVKPTDSLSQNEQFATLKPAESLVGYKIVHKNDLVMNIMRARNGSLGISDYDGIVSAAYCVYGLKQECDPRFIHYLLRTPNIVNTYEAYAYGICEHRRRLYADDFLRLYSVLPSIEEQKEILDQINSIELEYDNAILQVSREMELLKELRTKIISDAVTGVVDVRDIVIPDYDIAEGIENDEYETDEESEENEDNVV